MGYSLRPTDWLRLCLSEGVPLAYRVVTVPVDLYDGTCVQAFSLQASLGVSPGFGLKPSSRYLSHLKEGAREAGLRVEWMEKLESIRPAESSRDDRLLRDY